MTNGSNATVPIGCAVVTYFLAIAAPVLWNAPVIGDASSVNNQTAPIIEMLTTMFYPWDHPSATALAIAVGGLALYIQIRNS